MVNSAVCLMVMSLSISAVPLHLDNGWERKLIDGMGIEIDTNPNRMLYGVRRTAWCIISGQISVNGHG